MPNSAPLDLSIDPRTGNVHLAEGTAVIVEDELGKKHEGLITYIDAEADRFTVLLHCKRDLQEMVVREDQILARVAGGYEK